MKKPRIHKLPDGSEITNVELCRRLGVPIWEASARTTAQILNYHNRKRKVPFALEGKSATAAEWGKALNVSATIFRDTVYSCERAGGGREQAMKAAIRHLAGDRKPGGAIRQLRKIQDSERPTSLLA